MESLLPIIYQGLEITELEDDDTALEDTGDDAKWTVSRAAAALLQEVAVLVRDPVWGPTVDYMSPKLNSNNWREQYIGMTALGSVLEGPCPELIADQMAGPFSAIMTMVDTNQVDRVRFTSAQAIAKMCMVVPQLALVSEECLAAMFTTCINRISNDHW